MDEIFRGREMGKRVFVGFLECCECMNGGRKFLNKMIENVQLRAYAWDSIYTAADFIKVDIRWRRSILFKGTN